MPVAAIYSAGIVGWGIHTYIHTWYIYTYIHTYIHTGTIIQGPALLLLVSQSILKSVSLFFVPSVFFPPPTSRSRVKTKHDALTANTFVRPFLPLPSLSVVTMIQTVRGIQAACAHTYESYVYTGYHTPGAAGTQSEPQN